MERKLWMKKKTQKINMYLRLLHVRSLRFGRYFLMFLYSRCHIMLFLSYQPTDLRAISSTVGPLLALFFSRICLSWTMQYGGPRINEKKKRELQTSLPKAYGLLSCTCAWHNLNTQPNQEEDVSCVMPKPIVFSGMVTRRCQVQWQTEPL